MALFISPNRLLLRLIEETHAGSSLCWGLLLTQITKIKVSGGPTRKVAACDLRFNAFRLKRVADLMG